jgi:hypothetical protein
VVEDCGATGVSEDAELLAAAAAQAVDGRIAATGIDWSSVRRFMRRIVTEEGREEGETPRMGSWKN